MALKLVINISKKVPGPIDFSSVQASCSIEGELVAGQDPVAETTRLYAQAEAAVDRQLGIAESSQMTAPTRSAITPSTSSQPPLTAPRFVPSAAQRRAPALISPAQIRYLRQLLDQAPGALSRVLADHQIATIEQLTSRAASALIDRLKVSA